MQTKYIIFILLSVFLSISLSIHAQDFSEQQKTITKTLKLINTEYVDSIDTKKLVEDAIKAMISNLDPHSKYMDAETVKRSNESIRGSFGGVGIYYQILDDTMLILSTVKNGPSDEAGIIAGDRIIEIDDTIACGKSVSESFFSKRLRGKKGSSVKLKVLRNEDHKLYDINIKRGLIPIKTIDIAYMIKPDIGYIRFNMFSRSSMMEFNLAILNLKFKGMKHLIIDLRGNPGGLMIASINLADAFLTKEKLIVYTQGAHYKRDDFYSSANNLMQKGRLVVMMDEYSASASEIFGGAIQDWDRGLIMGRRSFGKGLVGRNFILPDGSAVRLTTGRYYTPSGRSIQKSYSNGRTAYNHELDRRYKHGEFIHADSINVPDSLKFNTKGGRTVYGGGGIMLDIFLPMDTSFFSDYLKKLNKKDAINIYSAHYYDKHLQELLKNYSTFDLFHSDFKVSDSVLEEFKEYSKNHFNIEATAQDWLTTKEFLRHKIKALLARNLFENGTYFQENADYDTMLQAAQNAIVNPKIFRKHGVQAK